MKLASVMAALLIIVAAPPAHSQGAQPGAAVTVEHITVHSAALEGNLEGEAADRPVIVYLPPDYARDKSRHFPVVYVLHGYGLTAESFAGLLGSPGTVDTAVAAGTREMIVVLPDTQTLHNGSMYSSSVTTGDWEGFITRDLVAYMDSHYRTIPDRLSRGLAGHSMGGYGTARLGMKYPEVYGALYIMSPCCMSARDAPPAAAAAAVEAVTSKEAAQKLDFMGRATFAVAAAWSPDPKKPPLYLDLPTNGGVPDKSVPSKWAANAPLSMLDQYIFNLKRYKAIAIDVGDQDGLRVDAQDFHRRMIDSGVDNSFEIYAGDHGNRVADRFQNHVLPFFARVLAFDAPGAK